MPPRQPSTRGDRARAAILRAATEVFATHGYRGGPLAAVATAAELTQPGLLHHFASKEQLLLAVLEQRDREAIRELDRGAWPEGGRAALDALRDLVAHNATTRQLVQMFTVLAGESVSDRHPAHDYFTDRYAHLRSRTTRAVRRGQDGGEFRSDVDAEAVATLILAVMDGLQVQWLLDDRIAMPPRFALFLDMLVTYLTPPGDTPPAGAAGAGDATRAGAGDATGAGDGPDSPA